MNETEVLKRTSVYHKQEIGVLCEELGCSCLSFWIAVVGIITSKVTCQKDISIRVISARSSQMQELSSENKNYIVLPYDITIDDTINIKDYIRQVQRTELNPQADSEVKEVLIHYEFIANNKPANEEEYKYDELAGKEEGIGLSVFIYEYEDSFAVSLRIFTEKYQVSLMDRKTDLLLETVQFVIDNSHATIGDIPLATPQEQTQIIREFNNMTTVNPVTNSNVTVIDLFEAQVEKTPEHTAMILGEDKLTYRELNEKANQLARRLRTLGVGPDDFVAISGERSMELIIGIYGILKAGGAYVPIDSSYPEERINYILKDCKPKAVLVYLADINTDLPVIDLKDNIHGEEETSNLKKLHKPSNLVYCIYTSGTTGKPKGVLIEHKSLLNHIRVSKKRLYHHQVGATPLFSNPCFDFTVPAIFVPLSYGGEIRIFKEPGDMTAYLSAGGELSLLKITPSQYKGISEELKGVIRVHHIVFGGETLTEDILFDIHTRFWEKVKLHNEYGPTEATVYVTENIVSWEERRIPIGKPVDNIQIYVLNGNRLCGIGIPGELCIAGEGLARGYLNQPELTCEKFVDNPFQKGKLYRSGDLARWLPDGKLEYLGRVDEQVKIRGFRIELKEVESSLRRIEKIKDGVVIARKDSTGEKAIHAYFVAEEELKTAEIKTSLRRELPDYMVPAYILQIDKIPVTSNGKLNKKALPEIIPVRDMEYIKPGNEKEIKIAGVFEEILGIKDIGIRDSFFELGGDSIKAIRIVSRLREAGLEVTVKDIMGKYTVEAIAEGATAATAEAYEQGEVTGVVPATPIISLFESRKLKKPHHYNQAILIRVDTGDAVLITKALQALVRHHDILRAVYEKQMLKILSLRESRQFDLVCFDYRNVHAPGEIIEKECTRLQGSIDLERGPLLKTALFLTAEGNYMLFALHHLIVDGISWRILTEDFNRALRQVKDNQKILLPMKTASFKDWGEALEEYKHSKSLQGEREYWSKLSKEMEEGLIGETAEFAEGGYGDIHIAFTEEETHKLVQKAGKAFRTEINDLLLSAIGMSLYRLNGQKKVTIGLEGHGREEIHKKIAIDLTVGWFTSIYPVIVEGSSDIKECIIAAKEMLRKVPNHGLGYGLLKKELRDINPDLYFNYLGEMDAEYREEYRVGYSCGLCVARENSTYGAINMDGSIVQGRLYFILTYDKSKHRSKTMEQFAGFYKECLNEIVNYCLSQKETVLTPSDYSDKTLTKEELACLTEVLQKKNQAITDIYPLTPLQEGMLYHSMLDRNDSSYVLQNVYHIKNRIREDLFVQALRLLEKRYDVLRTTICQEGLLRPRQVVLRSRQIEYKKVDLTGLCEETQKQKISVLIQEDIRRGFDLNRDTLIRFHYIALDDTQGKLIWSMHHIVVDAWCRNGILDKLINIYDQLTKGIPVTVLEKNMEQERAGIPEYKEYIKWLQCQQKEAGLAYWKKLLEDYDKVAEIKPMLKPEIFQEPREPAAQSEISISSPVTKKILEIASGYQVTVNHILEAVWGVVLQRYNRCNDVVFGKIVSGRNADIKRIEQMTGLLVNTIPLRVKCDEETTVPVLIKALKQQGSNGNGYEYCSLAEIQNLTSQKIDLIKTLFAFENYYIAEDRKRTGNGLQAELETAREQTNYAVSVSVSLSENQIHCKILYNPKEFNKTEIELVLARIERVLIQIAAAPEMKVRDIDVVTEKERELILKTFNPSGTPYPKEKTMAELFEEQAEKYPEHTALVYGDTRITYLELNRKANQVARKLREIGVHAEDYVAILTERSPEMLTGILGILKAGGAYVPIDPSYPEERIKYILSDCLPKAVVVYRAEFPGDIICPLVDLADPGTYVGISENLLKINKPQNLAYCIYTSGSTGRPKGVMVEHRGVVNLREYFIRVQAVTEKERVVQFANFAFDAMVSELCMSLFVGGELHIIEEELRTDVSSFEAYIVNQNITALVLPPQYAMQVNLKDVRILITAGSESNRKLVEKNGMYLRYSNDYGPTENTVCATHWEYQRAEQSRGIILENTPENIPDNIPDNIPIGKPINNVQIYILKNQQLCGIGIPGELCIAGNQVARGYLNQPELTKEKFTVNPFGEGKLYRSGDLARWLPDGNLEYLGRMDEQVKIRGFRIELGEIENALRRIDGMKDAAVVARRNDNGDRELHAFIVSEEEIRLLSIRKSLSATLPDYMIPPYIMQLEKIPVTRNGKLDKAALPWIEAKSEKEYSVPRNETEEKIAEIFQEVLKAKQVGRKDSFLELGGDSIKALRIVSKLREAGYAVTLRDIMHKITVESIAESVAAVEADTYEQSEISGLVKATPILESFADWKLTNPRHFNQAVMLQAGKGEAEDIAAVLHKLSVHHDILRAVYRNQVLEILNVKDSKLYEFLTFDYRGVAKPEEMIEQEATKLQSSIDLAQGPLFKAAWFQTMNGNYVLLCLHHLVVDGVSWRILTEDFYRGLAMVMDKKEIILPPKTASYIAWGEALSEYRHSRQLAMEKEYWRQVTADMVSEEKVTASMLAGKMCSGDHWEVEQLACDLLPDTIEGTAEIHLNKTETEQLLHKAGRAYHTEINDLLLSALGISVNKLTGQKFLITGLEGHGREVLHKELDIDRTVGWFTSIYPVLLTATQNIQECIVTTKEMLRKVPNHGMGYGLLRKELPEPAVCIYFNYLGDMDTEGREEESAGYSCGLCVARENRLPGAININGRILQRQLSFTFTYDRRKYSDLTMKEFAELYYTSLKDITEHCTTLKETVMTVSDSYAANIEDADLDIINLLF